MVLNLISNVSESDLILIIITNLNSFLHFFKNRQESGKWGLYQNILEKAPFESDVAVALAAEKDEYIQEF